MPGSGRPSRRGAGVPGWARRLAGSAAVASALAGCADLAATRDVRVTVVDENMAPLPGAVFFVEASDASGAFAFLWREAGRAGEVPDSAREPLKIPWRPGARLAMVAFAPGRTPAVLRETGDLRRTSDGAVLVLQPGEAWNPELSRLAAPFEHEPVLAARLQDPAQSALLAALRAAWAAAPADLGPEDAAKRSILANPGQGTGREGRS